MKLKLLVSLHILVLVISGCTVSGEQAREARSEARFASYSVENDAFFRCGSLAARAAIREKPGTDPRLVGFVAKQVCQDERARMIAGIKKAHNSEIWLKLIEIADRKFEEQAIAVAVLG